MSDLQLVHVKLHGCTEQEAKDIRDIIEEPLQDYAGEGEIIVTDENLGIRDSDLDALAEQVAERLNE
jgi:hypothetical protein